MLTKLRICHTRIHTYEYYVYAMQCMHCIFEYAIFQSRTDVRCECERSDQSVIAAIAISMLFAGLALDRGHRY